MASTSTDRVVWITGGGSGIGRACAAEFARRGARVAVSGRRLEALQEVVTDICEGGGVAAAVRCDVTREDDLAAAVRSVVDRFGRVDVAFANAGFAVGGRIEDLDLDAWRRQFETNVFGVVATARAVLPELRMTGGRLALMGSVAAYVAPPGNGPYSASKHAVRAIGETLAAELAGSGVSCTTIHPGYVHSDIARVDNQGRFVADRVDRRPASLLWDTDAAARVIVRAIERRKREYVFTRHGKLAVGLARLAPSLPSRLMGLGSRRSSRRRNPEPA